LDKGPLEYGGIDGFAALNASPLLWDPGSGERYTNYFRREFTTNRAYTNVGAEILADDGAVIYLDGQEVARFNCCNTPEDDYLSFSSAGGNETSFATIPLVSNLAAGNHLLAVSVHQANTTSSDLGFGFRLVTLPAPDPNALPGTDTVLSEAGLAGPDGNNSAAGTWEWDMDDGGGQNHGLIKLDIPADRLAAFGNGTATLRLSVANGGNNGEVYRMTRDWLSGPNGGNNVTWNNMPGGPGLVPGGNMAATPTTTTGDAAAGDTLDLDVTADVLAWAAGTPNYGWGFLPTGGDAIEISAIGTGNAPQLILTPGAPIGKQLQAGDADQDYDFDQLDLVKVQIAAKYLTGQAATWGEGDWNGAPGGTQGNPPRGDGFFNQMDIIAASLANKYLQGPYAAVATGGTQGDGQTSVIYNANTGEVAVDAPAGTNLTSINIDSASSIFTGEPAQNLGGSFDNDKDNNIFKATFGGSFGSLTFGNVAQPGLSQDYVAADLTVVGSLAGGGALGNVDLVYIPVPEPSAVMLLALGLAGVVFTRRPRL
jgi:hypothetical protein